MGWHFKNVCYTGAKAELKYLTNNFMKNVLIVLIALLLIGGGVWYFMQEEAEELDTPSEEEVIPEEEVDRDNPYETAETVVPVQERNEVMHETFGAVLEEVFEKEPRLVSSGDILVLSYIVDRAITPDDVAEVRSFLEEEGYELEGTDIEDDSYDLNFSAKILDYDYQGNIYVLISTAEEGEDTQTIEVRIL